MPNQRQTWARKILIACGGIASVIPLFAVVLLLIWVSDCVERTQSLPAPVPRVSAAPAAGARFTLRLGQGFRLKEGAIVVAKPEEAPDIVFKSLPPQVGGMALRYNPISQQVEQGLEPTLTSPVPLLLSTHINSFEQKP